MTALSASALAARAVAATNPAFFNSTAVPLASADDWTVCVASTDEATDKCCASASGVRCPIWGCRLSLKDSAQQSTFTTCTDNASGISNGGRKRACKSYQATYDEALKQLQVGEGWWSSPLAEGHIACSPFGGRNESAAECCTAANGQKQAKDEDKHTPETCMLADADRAKYEECVQEKHDAYAVCTSSVATAAPTAAPSAAANVAKSAAAPGANRKTALALAALAVAALGAL